MLFKITVPMIGCLLSLNATAGMMGNSQVKDYPWSVAGSLGYTWYDHAYHGGPGADPSAQKGKLH